MANISLINLTGVGMSLKSLNINGTNIPIAKPEIVMLQGINLEYKESDWQKFSRFIMEIDRNGVTYKVDLNRDHYFGGGDYRYPGSGSKVRYILSGFSFDQTMIQIKYAYNSPDLEKYKYSNDIKYLKKS